MARKSDAFVPYATPEELAKGKRRAARYLVIAAAALVLAVVADRVVADEHLRQVYLLAGLLHLVAAVGPILRITRTGELEPVE
ncbi:hypothetical protein [Nocardioides antri]|uniref:Uncharacterized protein n=1 Tax=Nocardioides antri TaxID=2607659 RepID=A0A5B1M5G0_9ACTN|nr:hypothetical protein [Nocardioides antri]KAA1427349.1 hypothetical protein F0U47_07650 [Nocardioides antri]